MKCSRTVDCSWALGLTAMFHLLHVCCFRATLHNVKIMRDNYDLSTATTPSCISAAVALALLYYCTVLLRQLTNQFTMMHTVDSLWNTLERYDVDHFFVSFTVLLVSLVQFWFGTTVAPPLALSPHFLSVPNVKKSDKGKIPKTVKSLNTTNWL